MGELKGFGDFYSRYNRSARADGGADAAATTTTGGKSKMSEEGIAALIASIGSAIGNILPGVGSVIDSSRNTKQLPEPGAQYMSIPNSNNNKTLLWVLGGGALRVGLVLAVVLRKK